MPWTTEKVRFFGRPYHSDDNNQRPAFSAVLDIIDYGIKHISNSYFRFLTLYVYLHDTGFVFTYVSYWPKKGLTMHQPLRLNGASGSHPVGRNLGDQIIKGSAGI